MELNSVVPKMKEEMKLKEGNGQENDRHRHMLQPMEPQRLWPSDGHPWLMAPKTSLTPRLQW